MSLPRPLIAACVLAALTAACAGGTDARRSAQANRIVGQNLRFEQGTAVRFGFTPSQPFADALVTFEPPSSSIMLCPLAAVTSPLPPASSCRTDVASGVRDTVTVAGLGGLAIVATRGAVSADVVVEFEGATRAIGIRVPRIEAPGVGAACADADCSPLFEVTPARDGAFQARASWVGPPATLQVLQGRILARSFTATGLPYREVATSRGPATASVSATLSSTGEYALILRQAAGTGALTDVRIDATWP